MVVQEIKNAADFQSAIQSNPSVVVDCFATWCGPCKAISPQVDKFSDEFGDKGVTFVKIDVDEVPDVAQELGITAMPTFIFFHKGEQVRKVVGANPGAIRTEVQALAGMAA